MLFISVMAPKFSEKCVLGLAHTYRQIRELVSIDRVPQSFIDKLEQIACYATTHRQKSQVNGLPPRMENLKTCSATFCSVKLV